MGEIEAYVTWIRASGGSRESIRLRRHYLTRLAERYPGRSLLSLSLDELVGYLARPDWAAETRKSARGAVRGFYRWACDTGRLGTDPSRLLPTVRVPPGCPRPTPDAVFLAALERADDRARCMLMLAAFAGLRRAEIARVHSGDLLGDALRVAGKGGAVRMVPLTGSLAAELHALPAGWAFPGQINGHLAPHRVGVILARLLGPGWSAHTLRHRFATRAYAVERDLRAVQTLLGHSKPETTARYTAVPDGALRRAVQGSMLADVA